MAPWVDLPLATGAGGSRSPFVSDAELVNLMLVPNPAGSPRPFAITDTPGLLDINIGEGASLMRGLLSHSDRLWFVKGTGLWYSNGTVETQVVGGVGSIAGTARVRMVGTDTDEIVVVADSNTYLATTSTITAITPPVGTYIDAAWVDGSTVYARSGTDEFYISSIDDPTTIAALDFSTADGAADRLVGLAVNHRDVILFGEKHAEFWYNTGAASFPFERAQPGIAERGCFSVGSIAKHGGATYFLGDDFRVYSIEGYRPTVVSTPWVDRYIKLSIGLPANVYSGTYSHDGQSFYILGLGVAGAIVYDIGGGTWHVRTPAITAPTFIGVATRGLDIAIYAAYNSASSYGELYKFDHATYRDSDAGGSDTTRTLTCPAIDGGGTRLFESEVEMSMEQVDGGSPGTVTLKYSDDGGTTYTTHSAQSTNQSRVRWTRCGSFYRRIHRFEFTTNARVAVSHVRARIDRGA